MAEPSKFGVMEIRGILVFSQFLTLGKCLNYHFQLSFSCCLHLNMVYKMYTSERVGLNPGPAGPVSIRIRYACLFGGLRIYPGSPGK